MPENRRRLVVVAALALLAAVVLPAALSAQSGARCFEQTGFCISGRIRTFWEQNGGLPAFGYPIGPQQAITVEGRAIQAQWFERNRLELHPENQPPYDVLLGRLGDDRLIQQGRDWRTLPAAPPASPAGCRFFPETGRTVCGAILRAWQAQGLEADGRAGTSYGESLALWGLPLSDPQREVLEGRSYTVQWFERARFELHPENQPPYDVLLGLLGREVLAGAGPTPATATPRPPQTAPTPSLTPRPTNPLDRRDVPPGSAASAGGLTFDAISCSASDASTSPPLTLDPLGAPGAVTGELGQRISLCFASDGVTAGQFARDTPIGITISHQGAEVARQQVAPLPDSDFDPFTPDSGTQFVRWRWTPPALGTYEVAVQQGEVSAAGVITVVPATRPRYAAIQRVFRPGDNEFNRRGLPNYRLGDTVEILLTGFAPNTSVGLLLYGAPNESAPSCEAIEGATFTSCFLTRVEATTDANGDGRVTFPALPSNVGGLYLVYWEGEPFGVESVRVTGFQPNIFTVLAN